jgi:UDP-N-acetyl-D-galactosamine dehydrogenase
VDVEDPYADSEELKHEYGFGLAAEIGKDYDAVIICVPHQEYCNLDDSYFTSITREKALIADLKGIYRNKIKQREYWSL